MKDAIKEKVFTAIGEASMCWDPIPTGVFDSTAAQKVGERLVTNLASAVEDEPKDCGFTLATCPYERCAGITMRKSVEVEPLAVLADKKSFEVEIGKTKTLGGVTKWAINFWQGGIRTPFYGSTYTEAEAKARAFLSGLPDKETI